jgi:hypothetical protein
MIMSTNRGLDELGRRLTEDGCEVRTDQVGGRPALVGHRVDFLPQMLFSRIHLYTVAADLERVTGDDVWGFATEVSRYVKSTSNSLRGVQSGIAAFSVLLSPNVSPDAIEASSGKAPVRFALRVQPLVVDTSTGAVHTNRKGQFFGFMMNGHLRRKVNLYFPVPAAVA